MFDMLWKGKIVTGCGSNIHRSIEKIKKCPACNGRGRVRETDR